MPSDAPRRRSASATLVATLALLLPSVATAQTKPGSASLARYVPSADLIFYFEFDGLDAHKAAWKKSALYQVLNETKLGALLEDLARQAIDQALATSDAAGKPTTAEVLDLIKATLRDGFVLVVRGTQTSKPTFSGAVRRGDRNGFRALMDKMNKVHPNPSKSFRRGTRTILIGDPEEATGGGIWAEGDDIVFADQGMAALDATFAAIDGKAPSAATHPVRVDLGRASGGFEPILFSFFDIASLGVPPDPSAKFALDGFKRIDYRWGFQDDALMSVLRIVAPAPRRGLLAMLEPTTFEKATMPPVPAGLTSWTAFSFAPKQILDRINTRAKALSPPGGPPSGLNQFDAGFRQFFGMPIGDVLGMIGPKWLFTIDPPSGKGKTPGLGHAIVAIELRDQAGFAKFLATLMPIVNQGIKGQLAKDPRLAGLEFKKVEGSTPGWRLPLPAGLVPGMVGQSVAPTILIGRTQLAIGLNDADARLALSATAWKAGPDLAAAMAKVPGGLVAFGISDPRVIVPEAVAGIPAMVPMMNLMIAQAMQGKGKPFALRVDPKQVPTADEIRRRLFTGTMAFSLDREGYTLTTRESFPSLSAPAIPAVGVALLLPAVQAAREAARRAQCVNNLKQIGLACFNYEDRKGELPAAAIVGKDGKPLLSWRVAILPYIEQETLYKRFHLDEPWDSPNNKALILLMPKTYQCPSVAPSFPGATTYRTIVGKGALLDLAKGTKLAQITDGTSNTIMAVETGEEVTWTKPEDVAFDPAKPGVGFGLVSKHPGGFNALFADGSVRFFKWTIDQALLKKMMTRAGGEVITIP